MTEPTNLEAIMGLIMYGGEAKGKAVEAIREAKLGNIAQARTRIDDAYNSLNVAHNSQTELLSQEAAGQSVELSLLMVHGQDHLMTALTFIDMAKEVIDVYEKLAELS
ncbi:PTS lactose/cellobiose transporter subunit IIA [Streptococcus halotolerans]|uniref:PTS lactose/cellobiose transporter subunit IIA n=1 Tax=Streptococcus halotolerans TaxID=1814128 RepID=UPI0007894FA9|nr:PTS lactose/cellobiose transporter subunit IIA [Streptococcus halotolerans]